MRQSYSGVAGGHYQEKMPGLSTFPWDLHKCSLLNKHLPTELMESIRTETNCCIHQECVFHILVDRRRSWSSPSRASGGPSCLSCCILCGPYAASSPERRERDKTRCGVNQWRTQKRDRGWNHPCVFVNEWKGGGKGCDSDNWIGRYRDRGSLCFHSLTACVCVCVSACAIKRKNRVW